MALGLGLMLLALRLLLAASAPIRDAAIVQLLFAALTDEPLIAVLVAALLTWLAHSSLAVVLLTMSLASAGVLTLPGRLHPGARRQPGRRDPGGDRDARRRAGRAPRRGRQLPVQADRLHRLRCRWSS